MRMGLSRTIIIRHKHRDLVYTIFFLTVLSIGFLMSLLFIKRLELAFLNIFSPYAINLASDSVNNTMAEYFENNNYTYDDFMTVTFNQNNEITSVQANSSFINKVKAELSINLQAQIDKLSENELSFPVGSISDSLILNGFGPEIKIKVYTNDISDLRFYDSFESTGINQTLHKVYLNAVVTITASCARFSKSETVEETIPIAQTVIVGEVPKYYADNTQLPQISTAMEE